MATPFLSGIDLYGSEVKNAVLEDAKLAELVGDPEPGKIYKLADGTPYYVTEAGVPTPIHEYALREISTGTSAVILETHQSNGVPAVDIAIVDAGSLNSGLMSAEHYALLAGATAENIAGSLIIRGSGSSDRGGIGTGGTYLGDTYVALLDASQVESTNILTEYFTANQISVNEIVGENFIVLTPSLDPPTDAHLTQKRYVDSAIATAVNTLDTGVSAVTAIGPIAATPPDTDGVVGISITPADDTNPGTLSPEHYALLTSAGIQGDVGSLVTRGDGENPTDIPQLQANYIQANGLGVLNTIFADSIEVTTTNPVSDLSATNVVYVRDQIQLALRDTVAAFDRKAQGVRVAVGTNTALTSTFGNFDGVAIAATDQNKSILLHNQSLPAENGAYDVTTDGLVRRADSSTVANLTNGASYQVEDGTFANHVFTLITQNGFTIDTDPLTFLDISGVNVLASGDGISIANQRINARTTVNRLIVNADGNLDIALAYDTAVDNKISTAISSNNSATKFATNLGNGTDTVFNITHNLETTDVVMSLRENTLPGAIVFTDLEVVNRNTIRATFGSAPAVDAYRITIIA